MKESTKRDGSAEASASSYMGTVDGVQSGGNWKTTKGSAVNSDQDIDEVSGADTWLGIDEQWGETTRTQVGDAFE